VSQPEIEEELRPCAYPPCDGLMEADLAGDCVIWECRTCGNETYSQQEGGEDLCAAGLSESARRLHEPPGAPVFLGPAIPRRPQ
jgi:hypothetical protein